VLPGTWRALSGSRAVVPPADGGFNGNTQLGTIVKGLRSVSVTESGAARPVVANAIRSTATDRIPGLNVIGRFKGCRKRGSSLLTVRELIKHRREPRTHRFVIETLCHQRHGLSYA
jgi:hypothetical protein